MIKKIINKIINETLKCKSFLMSFFKSKYSLIILDDFYPHLHSGFRVAEYNYYLNTTKDSVVLSTGSSFRLINSKIPRQSPPDKSPDAPRFSRIRQNS